MNKLNKDLLKQVKKLQREEEIRTYGKLISLRKSVTVNKKHYKRNQKHRKDYDSYSSFAFNLFEIL